ncbi:MAG: hypothetical protein AAF203_07070, partial [Pseudomonadota bacterium]
INQKDVCKAWHEYFSIANDSRKSDRKKLHHLWKAHGLALYHSYWQYADFIVPEGDPKVPQEEYEIWMYWSRFVGLFTPRLLRRSCGSESYPLARVLMPNCIFGMSKANGRECRLSKRPRVRHLYLETSAFLWVRRFLVSDDLGDLLNSFEKGLGLPITNHQQY